jgi:hypothetical protein
MMKSLPGRALAISLKTISVRSGLLKMMNTTGAIGFASFIFQLTYGSERDRFRVPLIEATPLLIADHGICGCL